MSWPGWFDARLLDVALASAIGFLLFSRISEQRSLWLLRGYLLLVALAWAFKRFELLPLTAALIEALVLACSLSLAILWQGELRRLMELLGTWRLGVLLANPASKLRVKAGTVAQLTDAAGRLSQSRRGALIVVDLGSDLRPEDFLNPGVSIDAQLSSELLLNLFASDTPSPRRCCGGERKPHRCGGCDSSPLPPGPQPVWNPSPGGPGHHRAV